ncbi:hypothetical protein SDC9_107470 [bioreactor metagenome]|uniref:Uncharacterized protein n=1 Tax=bioreactor metagenome TaxID=1076179 RepID=A0A645B6D0_9ZZZZ
MVFLRVFIESRYGFSPHVAQVNSRPGGIVRTVSDSVVFIGVVNSGLGRKRFQQIAIIRESVGNPPLYVGLFYVGKRLIGECVFFVPEHPLLEIDKTVENCVVLVGWQDSPVFVEILTPATAPGPLGKGKH